jgi:serine/threonine protein kinase
MSDIYKYEPLWGSWQVDKLLGEGSYGKVYQISSRNKLSEITHYGAVKIISIPQNQTEYKKLRAELSSDESVKIYYNDLLRDFIGEIDIMVKLQGYTNIVGFHDYMVMPLASGIGFDILIRMELLESLIDYTARNPLDEKAVARLGVDICKALETCSQYKIIHRDVKPDNIFVNASGDFKLGDFGIARQIERDMTVMSRKGTPLYMAPEVFERKAYNGSVDTYSLGIVMYRYLNHERVPFLPDYPTNITPTLKDQAFKLRLSNCPLPPLKEVSPALSNIVLKAASFDSNARFQNATKMRQAIEAFQAGRAIPIPTSPSPDLGKTILLSHGSKTEPLRRVSGDSKKPISKPKSKSNIPKARKVMNIEDYEFLFDFLILILLYSSILLWLTNGFAVILFISFIILFLLLKSIITKLKLGKNLFKFCDNLSDNVYNSRFLRKIKFSDLLDDGEDIKTKIMYMPMFVLLIVYSSYTILSESSLLVSIIISILYFCYMFFVFEYIVDNHLSVIHTVIFIILTISLIVAYYITKASALYYLFTIVYTNYFILGSSDLKLKLKIILLIVSIIILTILELFLNEDQQMINFALFVIIPSISAMVSGYLLHKSEPHK